MGSVEDVFFQSERVFNISAAACNLLPVKRLDADGFIDFESITDIN